MTPRMAQVRDEFPTAIDDPPEFAFVRDDVKGFKSKPAGAQRLSLHDWVGGFIDRHHGA